jgi:S1-C subfamily serine protease
MVSPVILIGLAAAYPLAAQAPPAPPAPPKPPAYAQAPAPPAPVKPPAPPAPPAAAFAFAGRYAPGLLFAPAVASQSYLGVHLMDVSEGRAREIGMKEAYGVEIMSVASDSPAEQGGIRKGDVIVSYAGQRVEGQEQLVRLVRETPIGRKVDLAVFRGGSEVKLAVEIGERKISQKMMFNCGDEPCEIHIPDIKIRPFEIDIPRPRMVTQSRMLGAELESIDGQLAEHFGVKEGVLVRSVETDSPASRAGLKAGDVIVEVAGKTVRDTGQIREFVRDTGSEKTVSIGVFRNRSRVGLEMERQARDAKPVRQGRRVVNRDEQY